MPLLTLGISHHTAPIEIRERVTLSESDFVAKLNSLKSLNTVDEALLLATCNRTELYCSGQNLVTTDLLDWVHDAWGLRDTRIDKYFYSHRDKDAIRHLIRVAGGMESLVLGESQILGQLKKSWQQARLADSVGNILDRMCQHAVTTAKSIRHQTAIGDKPISVAYTAIVLARQLFSDLDSKQVLLIGAGEMIELCARHLSQQGVTRLAIANRDVSKAERLAKELNATPVALSDLDSVLHNADILISSTGSETPVVRFDAVKQALRKRRYRPMFMVDIAVPRDVEPAIDKLDNVYLYTIDDLQQVVDENLEHRNREAQKAEPEIEAAVEEFVRWMNGNRASSSLQLLRQSAHIHGQELVDKAMRRLEAGHDQKAVLEQLTTTLANRILHAPSTNLRKAAEQDDIEMMSMINRIYTPTDAEVAPARTPESDSESSSEIVEEDAERKAR